MFLQPADYPSAYAPQPLALLPQLDTVPVGRALWRCHGSQRLQRRLQSRHGVHPVESAAGLAGMAASP